MHGHIGCRAARHVRQLHAGRERLGLHERCGAGRGHAPSEHRQAELLDTEIASLQTAIARPQVLELNGVSAQLGGGRYLEFGYASKAAIGTALPFHRHGEFITAALVRKRRLTRQIAILDGTQTVLGLCTDKVLHRHGFARAQQAAVQHRMRHIVRRGAHAMVEVEAPAFDAALPVGPHEGHVGRTIDRGTGAHKVGAAITALLTTLR